MEASDVVPMFPTLLWKIQLAASRREAINAAVLRALAPLRGGLPPLSPGQGWQSEPALHRLPELADLVSSIHRATQGVLRFLKIGAETFEITGCWATVLAGGAQHRLHTHPNNFLSGIYYVRAPAGADTVNFHDPRAQTAVIRPPVTALTAENTDQVVVSVKSGTLLLFPSYLPHSVDATACDEERISVSFNIMFTAFTERLSTPLW
jgi:uncharacterized protein (TIGR02466 family)